MSRSRLIIVSGKDGLRGVIEAWNTRNGAPLVTVQHESGQHSRETLATGQQILMRLEDGDEVLVPSDALVLQEDGSYYLPYSLTELERQRGMGVYRENDALVVPVLVEELDVHKRRVETGSVSITKHVHERDEIVDLPLLEERVEVERVAINRVVDSPIPIRYEGDTMIMSILEEVLVVEKRLLLKEELHITRRQHDIRKPQRITLRNEEASVTRNSHAPRYNDDQSFS